jgi:lipase chaperone LimK
VRTNSLRQSATAGIGIVATVCTIALLWSQLHTEEITRPTSRPLLATAFASDAAISTALSQKSIAASRNQQPVFASSLRGTTRDGQLRVDERGDLVVERGIRDLFDYYLTTLGEHGIDAIRSQLQVIFTRDLPVTAAQQATRLLDAYLRYRELSGELQQQYPALDENNAFSVISDYFSQRDNLRHQLFEPDAVEAFFAAEQTDEGLALPKLRQLTGESATATDNATESPNNYSQYRETMRTAVETDNHTADTDALRTQLFGREAAERMAALDQRRQDWRTRLASYREQKQQLLVAAAQAGIDPSHQLQQLRQSQFTEREILRVRALDKLEQIAP